jgi:hypothetical protein
MDTKFQSSFIPKQPVNEPVRYRSGSNIFFLISFLIFIVGCVGVGGVYLWDKQMDKKITDINSSLIKFRNSFDQNTIREFTYLNNRINSADVLLKQHVAPSVLFKIIGDVTLKNVRFSNFKYSNAGSDKVSISMSGEAKSYEAVALQSSAFTNPKLRNVFRNILFSDPDLNSDGTAVFSFSTGIDPSLLNYYKLKSDPNNRTVKATTTGSTVDTANRTAPGNNP